MASIGLYSECKKMQRTSNLIFSIQICQWKRSWRNVRGIRLERLDLKTDLGMETAGSESVVSDLVRLPSEAVLQSQTKWSEGRVGRWTRDSDISSARGVSGGTSWVVVTVLAALRLAKVVFLLVCMLLRIATESTEQWRNIPADSLFFSVAVKSQIHRPVCTVS